MKSIGIILFLFIIPIALFSQQRGFKTIDINIDGTTTPLYTKSYALIIGISDYTNGWSDLPGVSRDISAVKQSLEGHGFNVTVVKNANSREIKDAFDSFISKYSREFNTRLLVYFSGHGYTLKQSWGGEMGYIVPADAPNPNTDVNGFEDKAIDMEMMEVYAKRMSSKHALFMFDCCFSGSIFSLSKSAPAIISYKTSEPVRQFITAGSADEEVPDESIFCRQFVTGLDGDADLNEDGYISGSELGEYLQTSVVNYSYNAQHPQYGKIRNPNLDKGDFIFVVGNNSEKEKSAPPISIAEETKIETGSVRITSFFAGKLSWEYGFLRNVSANSTFTINDVPVGKHVFNLKSEGGEETQISKQYATVHSNQVAEVIMGNPGSTTVDKDDINSIPAKKKTETATTTTPHESFSGNSGTFTDTRDGQRYTWIRIGTQIWMAENLNYETNNSWCYDNDKSNCDTYGRLYNWKAAMKACPSRWHLPSDDEWKTLEMEMGMSQSQTDAKSYRGTYEGKIMKSMSGWSNNGNGINSSGFNARPGGYRNSDGSFYYLDYHGYWWSSTEYSGTHAWGRHLYYGNAQVDRDDIGKTYGFSVRCLKN